MEARAAASAEPSTSIPTQGSTRQRLLIGSAAVLGLWVLGVLLVLPQAPGDAPARVERSAPPFPLGALDPRPALENISAQPSAARMTASAPVSSGETAAVSEHLRRSSLRGSEVDGAVRLGSDGRLRMDTALVDFFEYHLALLGELDLDAIRDLLAEHVEQRVGADAVPRVLAAFERYLGLRQALAALPAGASLTDTLQARISLERQWFGDDAEAMFGEAREHDARTAQRLERGDAELEPWQRSIAPAEREARVALLAEEQSRQFEALGLPVEQRRLERTALWGAQAAARLDALDAERAAWDARLQAYARERDRLVSTGTANAAALDALRQRSFDPRERLRVEGMERSGAL